MNPWTRLLRTLGAAAVAVCFVMAGGSGNLALANGIGDIWAADSSQVLEIVTKPGAVVDCKRIPASSPSASATPGASPSASPPGSPCAGARPAIAAPTQLAFSSQVTTQASATDHILYTANGTPDLYALWIAGMTVQAPVTFSGNVVAIAHPKGASLYVSVAGSDTLSYLNDNATTAKDLKARMSKGSPDILAADLREDRVVAAKKGESWVAIVDQAGAVRYVSPSGSSWGRVVAAVIARDEGVAWVLTETSVAKVDLTKGTVDKSWPLSSKPTAIAAMNKFAVVAIDQQLYRVDGNGVLPWATEGSPVLQLSSDMDARYVYLGTATEVIALAASSPTKPAVATIALPNGAISAFVPIPDRASALIGSGGSSASTGPGAGNGTTTGSAKPRRTHAPATDTVGDILGAGPGADLTTVLLVGGALVVGVTVASHYLIKRLIKA